MIDLGALHIMLAVVIGWLDRQEREAIADSIEENRLLPRQLGGRRRLTDDDRLAARAFRVGRVALREIATIASPGTLLRWRSA